MFDFLGCPLYTKLESLTEKRQTKIEVLNIRGYIRLFPEREDNWTIIKTVEQNKLSFSEKIFLTLTGQFIFIFYSNNVSSE